MSYDNITNITERHIASNSLKTKDYISIIIFAIIFCVGVLGNTLVILIYGSQRSNNKCSKIYKLMQLLGIADLISSIANPSFYIYLTITRYRNWHFGYIGCKVIPIIGPISTNVSAGIILILTIDRYRAVAAPLRAQLSVSGAYKCSFVVLLLSVLSYLNYALHLGLSNSTCKVVDQNGSSYDVIKIVILIIWDATFLFVFIFTGIVIGKELRTVTQRVSRSLSTTSYQEHGRRDSKIIKMVLIVCISFVICIFPRDMLHIVYNFAQLFPPKIPDKNVLFINSILKILHTLNSTINVFIYSASIPWFRKEVRKRYDKLRRAEPMNQQDSWLLRSRGESSVTFIEQVNVKESKEKDKNVTPFESRRLLTRSENYKNH